MKSSADMQTDKLTSWSDLMETEVMSVILDYVAAWLVCCLITNIGSEDVYSGIIRTFCSPAWIFSQVCLVGTAFVLTSSCLMKFWRIFSIMSKKCVLSSFMACQHCLLGVVLMNNVIPDHNISTYVFLWQLHDIWVSCFIQCQSWITNEK